MNGILSLALLIGGVALVAFGVNATHSFASDVSRFFTGSPTDKAVWTLLAGVVAMVAGVALMYRGPRRG
jgi:uncharacterized membrane protein YidH (DUF202 family)